MKVSVSAVKPEEGKGKNGKYDDWYLKEVAETLTRAQEYKQDAKLMKAVKPMLEKRAKGAIRTLDDLRQKQKDLRQAEMVSDSAYNDDDDMED